MTTVNRTYVAAGFATQSRRYLDTRRARGQNELEIRNIGVVLRRFFGWCADRGVDEAAQVTRAMMESYQRWLFYFRKPNGKPLSPTTQYIHLTTLRMFFSWLTKQGHILYNPAAELEMPKLPKRLPRDVLTEREVETLMSQPDIATPMGLRDRAMLEMFYSTGMRRMEVTRVGIHDVNFDNGTVMVRFGKGMKDRVVPIGDRALKWIEKYLVDVRPTLVMEPDEGRMFLNQRGELFQERYVSVMVREYVLAAGIPKKGGCHMLRHTMATLMLEHGADVRFIQAILGHSDLSTTEVYTRVSIGKLKEVHTATHPGATLQRKERPRPAAAVEEDLMTALSDEAGEEDLE